MFRVSADDLAAALLQTASPVVFAAAGGKLAQLLVEEPYQTPGMLNLIDAMDRRLTEVRWAVSEHKQPAVRVGVAVAAAALAYARPSLTGRVRSVIAMLIGSAPPAEWAADNEVLAHRALLALALGDADGAGRAVAVLRDRGHVVGPVLARWAAQQRAQGTDPHHSWQLLRALSRRLDGPVAATMLVAAAFALPTASALEWSPLPAVRAEAPSMG